MKRIYAGRGLMNDKSFSISAALREGWELTKVNIGFLVIYQIILSIVAYIFTGPNPSVQSALLGVIGAIIVLLGKMGFYNSVLILTTGGKPSFDQFYKNWPKLLTWIVANFLFVLMFVIGLILIIVPGLYVWAAFGLFPFFILDKDAGPIQALKQAWQATQGVRIDVFLLFLACLGINILGLLFFFIGVFITFPVTLIALATVYRKLTGQTKVSIQPTDIME